MIRNMRKLTIEELKMYKYPNLMAEVQETTYSICTIAEWLGMGKYRKEDDRETWDKLTGRADIYSSEGIELCKLFGVDFKYLFSRELKIVCEKPAAYWRWFDKHEQIKKDLQRAEDIREIEIELRNKPYLLEFMKVAVTLDNEQLDTLIEYLDKRKVGVDHAAN